MAEVLEGEIFRSVMRAVASPVTVVTYRDDDEVRGVTIGSFASVSLEPPLISFNVSRDTSAFDVLSTVERMNVNVLSEHQAPLASHFALSGLSSTQQFDPVAYELDAKGLPVLSGIVTALFCQRVQMIEAGDSAVILAKVEAATPPADVPPLLYYHQNYHSVGTEVNQVGEVNRSSSATP
jgi:3-hydroxy-9,10-secoandrosta-1,3,5(10)-triene-9,17-dione monooxygenase reductase component